VKEEPVSLMVGFEALKYPWRAKSGGQVLVRPEPNLLSFAGFAPSRTRDEFRCNQNT